MLCYWYLMLFWCVDCLYVVFFFKQKTAYEMRISDWSSDVCSSDLKSSSSKPCSRASPKRARHSMLRARSSACSVPRLPPASDQANGRLPISRSEERRVGKE